jgi:hypothetical protein
VQGRRDQPPAGDETRGSLHHFDEAEDAVHAGSNRPKPLFEARLINPLQHQPFLNWQCAGKNSGLRFYSVAHRVNL